MESPPRWMKFDAVVRTLRSILRRVDHKSERRICICVVGGFPCVDVAILNSAICDLVASEPIFPSFLRSIFPESVRGICFTGTNMVGIMNEGSACANRPSTSDVRSLNCSIVSSSDRPDSGPTTTKAARARSQLSRSMTSTTTSVSRTELLI